MGLFGKTNCPICGKEVGAMSKSVYKFQGEYICSKCYTAIYSTGNIGRLKTMTLEEAKKIVKETPEVSRYSLKAMTGINTPAGRIPEPLSIKRIGGYFEADLKNKTWRIPGLFGGTQMMPYSMILDYELLEDGSSVTKGGASIGRAAVGGFLFGPAGLIIGGVTGKRKQKDFCTTMQIKITLNNPQTPTAYIKFITSKTKKSGVAYKAACKNAQEVLSLLNVITNAPETETSATATATISPADEIKKYKELLDSGAITKEEFEAKKKQLLGL